MKKQIKNFFRYRFLLWELTKKVIKLKYRRSYLGIIWSLIEPLLEMVVLTIVFGTLLGNSDPKFPVYILTGRLLYTFFSQGTRSSLSSIRVNASMIKKVYVPKYLYPLSSVLSNFIIFAISLIDLVGIMIFFRVYPTVYIVWAFAALGLLLLMTMGVGMILSTIGVFFRDLEYLWSVALMLIMYTCAIFYKPEKLLNSEHAWVLKVNPLYSVIDVFRAGIYGRTPDRWALMYALGFGLCSLLLGIWVFHKKQDKFILHI